MLQSNADYIELQRCFKVIYSVIKVVHKAWIKYPLNINTLPAVVFDNFCLYQGIKCFDWRDLGILYTCIPCFFESVCCITFTNKSNLIPRHSVCTLFASIARQSNCKWSCISVHITLLTNFSLEIRSSSIFFNQSTRSNTDTFICQRIYSSWTFLTCSPVLTWYLNVSTWRTWHWSRDWRIWVKVTILANAWLWTLAIRSNFWHHICYTRPTRKGSSVVERSRVADF